ncbi:MAG: iron ABC transporter permease [Clostridiales bacterium]|nr:iron ABC transporter permease [Clostridiales bacterium]MDY4171226.1 iron ABC transporter permease [Evtepia sp.]
MITTQRRTQLLIGLLVVLLLVGTPISLCIGRYPIQLEEIWAILQGAPVSETARGVFWTLRLPRTLMALLAGVGLSLSGYVYQAMFKNILASPDLIGVASGANAGVAVAIVLASGSAFLVPVFAFLGGMVAVLLAVSLAGISRRRSLASVVLAGIVIGSLGESIVMALKLFADPESQLAPLEFWAMGSLSSMTAAKLTTVLPGFFLGLVVLFLLRYPIHLLGLSDEEARALGVRVNLVRTVVILAATVMVASVVSVTGLISFIGLIAPHIARLLTRRGGTQTAVIASLLGALLLMVADCVARSVASSEIPLSILTSLIGAPFLMVLMLKRRSSLFY